VGKDSKKKKFLVRKEHPQLLKSIILHVTLQH